MSTEEIYADRGQTKRRRSLSLRLTIALALLIACAAGAAALILYRRAQISSQTDASSSSSASPTQPVEGATGAAGAWAIRGSLTEACTCNVPCSCNFGEGPSPHSYCHPFYSYDIRQGHYENIKLDGLRFGSADMRSARTIFIDERADESQRRALRIIAARVIERVSAEEAEAKAVELEKSVRYTQVKQEYGERRNLLEVAGIGDFAADYILGLDKSQPIVVRNNTTWRIRDAIKAKTTRYNVRVGRDSIDVKDTNSNQGEFEYTDKMDYGAPARWNCGACANQKAQACGR